MLQDLSQVLIIQNAQEFNALLDDIEKSGEVHALDFETTGLDWTRDLVRLANIAGPAVTALGYKAAVVDFFYANRFKAWAPRIARACPWAVFNAGFEGRFIDNFADYQGNEPRADLRDVGLMSKAKLGGRPLSLKQQILRDLDIEVTKEEQNSDWSQPELTVSQLVYAAEDGIYTYQLYEYWRDILKDDGLEEGFWTLNDSWRGTASMEDTGMTLDVEYHQGLIRMWTLRRDAAEACLRKFTPHDILPNLRSKKQISDLLKGARAAQYETWAAVKACWITSIA